jgi:hypothetical protein
MKKPAPGGRVCGVDFSQFPGLFCPLISTALCVSALRPMLYKYEKLSIANYPSRIAVAHNSADRFKRLQPAWHQAYRPESTVIRCISVSIYILYISPINGYCVQIYDDDRVIFFIKWCCSFTITHLLLLTPGRQACRPIAASQYATHRHTPLALDMRINDNYSHVQHDCCFRQRKQRLHIPPADH